MLDDLDSPTIPAPWGNLLGYARKLTLTPGACNETDIEQLRQQGLTDLQIVDSVQVAAYFNYINRVADALGVDLEAEMPPHQSGA